MKHTKRERGSDGGGDRRTGTPDFPPDNEVFGYYQLPGKAGLTDQPAVLTIQTSITDSHREEDTGMKTRV